MMSEQIHTLAELAEAIGAEVHGDAHCKIIGAASIVHAEAGDISYITNSQYRSDLLTTKASAVLLSHKFITDCPTNALVMSNPQLGFARVLDLLFPKNNTQPGIHPTAIIGSDCQIHPTAAIGPHVAIGDNVMIGAGTTIEAGTAVGERSKLGTECHLYPNVTLYHNVLCGDRLILHSGVVIGADGFGLAQNEHKHWVKVPQVGRVLIGNDVEIGANSAIDRGALNDTIIRDGVKIDNQVMIGHNCDIGDHTAIAGCAGIAGSTKVGRYCMIGASAGLNGHIEICDNVMITGFGMIQKSITKPGIYSSGTGMQTNREWHKSVIRFWQLDDIAKRLKRLERLHDDSDGK